MNKSKRSFITGLLASSVTIVVAPSVVESMVTSLTDAEFKAISALPYEDAFSKLVSTTLKNYKKLLADNITSTPSLYMYLKEKGNIIDGGASIVKPTIVD